LIDGWMDRSIIGWIDCSVSYQVSQSVNRLIDLLTLTVSVTEWQAVCRAYSV